MSGDAEMIKLYSQRILALASDIPHHTRLSDWDGQATKRSPLCGSTVTVDIKVDGDRVTDYGQTVKACLLGQSTASVMGREIVGTTRGELQAVAETMRAMLKQDGPLPTGRWADLGALQPVKAYRARHASTLLVFDAVEKAFQALDAQAAGDTGKVAALAAQG